MKRREIISPYVVPGLWEMYKDQRVVNKINYHVAAIYNINHRLLSDKTRKEDIRFPRQLCQYLICRTTNMTYQDIGDIYNRDHATVYHSLKVVTGELENNTRLKQEVEAIKKELGLKFIIKKTIYR